MRSEPSTSKAELSAELIERNTLTFLSFRGVVGRDVIEFLSGFHQPVEGVGIHDRAHSPVMTCQVHGLTMGAIDEASELVPGLGCGDLHTAHNTQ